MRAPLAWLACIASCVVASLCAQGCGQGAAAPATHEARRVVSIVPSTTEILFAIGAGDRVVGVSRYCDYPPEAATRPKVGGFTDPSLEAILALSPDLVVGARGPTNRGVVTQLRARGIDTFFPTNESYAQTRDIIVQLGTRTGRSSEARALVARMDAHLDAVRRRVAGRPKPRVLLVYDERPLSVAGRGSFGDEMLERAGGENVVVAGGAYPTLGIEQAVTLSPDVIVIARHLVNDSATRIDWSRYATVPAVRDGRVVRIGDESLLRPGPRFPDGVDALSRAIFGEGAAPR